MHPAKFLILIIAITVGIVAIIFMGSVLWIAAPLILIGAGIILIITGYWIGFVPLILGIVWLANMRSRRDSSHGGMCFVAGTEILVSLEGQSIPIQQLGLGERIICYDIKNGEYILGSIARVDVSSEPRTCIVTFSDDSSFECSPSQRILAGSDYVRTCNLKPGMRVNGLVIDFVTDNPTKATVYTFVVEPFDNFVVLAAKNPIVCHDNSTP